MVTSFGLQQKRIRSRIQMAEMRFLCGFMDRRSIIHEGLRAEPLLLLSQASPATCWTDYVPPLLARDHLGISPGEADLSSWGEGHVCLSV